MKPYKKKNTELTWLCTLHPLAVKKFLIFTLECNAYIMNELYHLLLLHNAINRLKLQGNIKIGSGSYCQLQNVKSGQDSDRPINIKFKESH